MLGNTKPKRFCVPFFVNFYTPPSKKYRPRERAAGTDDTMEVCHMNNYTTTDQPVYIDGRKVAVLRNEGMLCDIRRHNNGFLYAPHRVAVAEALLESLGDTVTLQFTNMDSGDVWTTTVRDFRHNAEPIQFGTYEPQRAVELSRMNWTIQGKPKGKKRRNELQHIDVTPVPQYEQGSFFG